MIDKKYHQVIRDLSERIVSAKEPIQILDAVKWGDAVEKAFFKSGCKELPHVRGPEFYELNPLKFDPDKKIDEFNQIERDLCRELGQFNNVGILMQRMCREYCTVIEMLKARGTPRFSRYTKQLYGSSSDTFYVGSPTLSDLAVLISNTLPFIEKQTETQSDQKIYTSEEASNILGQRLSQYFEDEKEKTYVRVSDDITADAATDLEAIKLRKNAMFSKHDLRVLEVHEGWVHLATTLNGLRQPICTFLSKESPSSPMTQEGLAVIIEIFTFSSHPARIQSLADRVRAISMGEKGGNFLDVFNFFREQGQSEVESYRRAVRVFRGSTADGDPFTKDLVYNKGFILIYNYIRMAVQKGLLAHLPLLFSGKTTLEDLPILSELIEESIVIPPKYVPPQFKDLAALSSWMCYSLFLNQLDLKRLAQEYKEIL